MDRCRSCQAEVKWIRTSVGHMMPVNPGMIEIIPQKDGSITIVTDDGRTVKGNRMNQEGFLIPDTIVKGYISHFATCPNASQYRRKKNE